MMPLKLDSVLGGAPRWQLPCWMHCGLSWTYWVAEGWLAALAVSRRAIREEYIWTHIVGLLLMEGSPALQPDWPSSLGDRWGKPPCCSVCCEFTVAMIDLAWDKAGRAPVCKSHVSFPALLFFFFFPLPCQPRDSIYRLDIFLQCSWHGSPLDHRHASSVFMLVTAIQIGFEWEDGWCHRHHSGGD